MAFIFHTLDAQYWTLGLKMLPNLASFLRILAILACLVGCGKFSDASEDYKAPPQNYSSTPVILKLLARIKIRLLKYWLKHYFIFNRGGFRS